MAVTRLWLVRHGESEGNVAASRAEREGSPVIALDARDADVELSPVGREQAQIAPNGHFRRAQQRGQLSNLDAAPLANELQNCWRAVWNSHGRYRYLNKNNEFQTKTIR